MVSGSARNGAIESEPIIPAPSTLWHPVRNWIWVAYLLLILAAIPDFFIQYWFNTSLGFHTIFFTNLRMQLLLAIGFGTLIVAAVMVPMRLYAHSPTLKKAAFDGAMWIGIFGAWRAATNREASASDSTPVSLT